MANNSMIPKDDLELELEEVEPLTAKSGGGGSGDPPGRKSKKLPANKLPVVRTASFGNNTRRPAGGGSHDSSSSPGGRKSRFRLLAVVAMLMGIAVLLVVRGEEEVEMEVENDPHHGQAAKMPPPVAVATPEVEQPQPQPQPQPKEEVAEPAAEPEPAKPAAAAEEPKKEEGNKPQTDEEKKKAMTDKWGQWHFWDGDPDIRPKNDYAADFPHRDITDDKFPADSWQSDAVYANHFLNDASDLITRAMDAVYAEYGWGKPLPPEKMMARAKITLVHKVDLAKGEKPPETYKDNGGWTTKRSFDGLVRRLLHAVMTNDTFVVVIVGDGVTASGLGHHFVQTYGMQFQHVMEPVFKRLNVKFETRFMIQEKSGGPLEAGLGLASILGSDVDLVVWDSDGLPDDPKMTKEKRDAEMDLFARQALLGGNRIPFLLDGGGFSFDVLKVLHERADVDVGGLGMGWSGIPVTESDDQAKELPWAVQYLRCKVDKDDLCDKVDNKYRNTCWLDRDDVKPPTKQDEHIDGQDKSHLGWRYQQLKGRMLAFNVLQALQEAINTWSDVTITAGHPLPDEYWHIADYYKTIREKVSKLDAGVGSCSGVKEFVPERVCTAVMRGRTEFTPRAYPRETSIVGMVKPAAGGYVPKVEEEMLYDGPDEAIPLLEVPKDTLDVRAIVSAGITEIRRLGEEAIVPGLGWEVVGELPGSCNGTVTGICGRKKSSSCLLGGHMDSRGGLLGNEYSGWLVMNVKEVKEGVIILKLETTHGPDENTRTKGWTEAKTTETKQGDATVDKKAEGEKVQSDRMLRSGAWTTRRSAQPRDSNYAARSLQENGSRRRQLLPDTFKFEFAIDGKVASLDKKEFEARKSTPRENVELLTVLDDAKMSGVKDVELAIRMTGCGRDCTFSLTHVYWA